MAFTMLEHVSAIGAGLLEAVVQQHPEAAPVLAGLAAYVGVDRAKFRKQVLEKLAERIAECEHRLDTEAITREGFAEIFSSVIETINKTDHQVKIDAAINVLENSLLKDGDADKIQFTELEFFAAAVSSLSIGSIHALGFVITQERDTNRPNAPKPHAEQISTHMRWHRDFAIAMIRELEKFHMVIMEETNMTYPGRRNAEVRSTSLGERFHDYILNHKPA